MADPGMISEEMILIKIGFADVADRSLNRHVESPGCNVV